MENLRHLKLSNWSKLLLVLGFILAGVAVVKFPPESQTLPITAQFTTANRTVKLEVALTQQQQAAGLSNRNTLADDQGMLFPFEPPQSVRFWMKNTLIPLDIVFLHNGVVQAIAANVPPCTKETCPTYGPEMLVNQVIELRGGRAAELGLKVGNRLQVGSK